MKRRTSTNNSEPNTDNFLPSNQAGIIGESLLTGVAMSPRSINYRSRYPKRHLTGMERSISAPYLLLDGVQYFRCDFTWLAKFALYTKADQLAMAANGIVHG